MNWVVLKDKMTVTGFSLAIILNVLAILIASKNNSFWISTIVFSFVILILSVRRADRLYRES
ncbi:hypothetical protein IHV12_05425 [Fictibacillus sp. 7GRE50]|uniref:hypothetical protein n=1 Tax=Fictibacillus TaxID=1329200 RepID=UPI0018CFD1EB|nr:hypothetical protein [Fictibacillus sp. 7GRE50]MBH0164346.1 hypothetical protein [Fictibacillus sp. 7GRE50]